MTSFLDTAVFMYAGGGEHPLRQTCRVILQRAKDGQIAATTSAEVIQEIVHRYMAIKRQRVGASMAREVLDAFRPVLPITDPVVRRLPELVERYPGLSARDLLHIATCLEEGIDGIISPDAVFDSVSEIRRIPPEEAAA
jgi:predicted nucleic acid-binding protein